MADDADRAIHARVGEHRGRPPVGRGTQDATMRVSGYGLSYRLIVPRGTGTANNRVLSLRIRLQADMTFSTIRSANSAGYTLVANGNGDGRGGTCNGDSGGPIFWPADSNQVVAVSSWAS